MKIERLDLKAFGCFTDVSLDFRAPSQGTFLIYGLNEAGKSTALEGIRQWLYGIDRNIPLDFRHKKQRQRIGGVVSDGEEALCCFRKRGNAGTLLDEHDHQIDDEALRPFLHGIDENRFRTIFGIDHTRLREGGKDIAEGKGDLGQALFTAGSGLLRLNRMQQKLEQENSSLFAVRGETAKINGCLGRCREIAERVIEERLTFADYEKRSTDLRDLSTKRDTLKRTLQELSRKQHEVDRLIRTIPLVQRREGLLTRRKGLGGIARLRDGFRTEFQQLDSDLLIEQAAVGGLEKRLEETEAAVASVRPDPEALREREALLQLSKRAPTYQTDYADRTRLMTERNQIQGEAKQILRRLGREPNLDADLIEPLRLDNQKRNRIRELGGLRAGHLTRLSTTRRRALELDGQVQALEERLKAAAPSPDTEGLSATLNRVLRMGDLEKDCERLANDLTKCDRAVREEHARMVLWSGDIEQISGVPIPSATDIEYHRGVIEAAEKNWTDAQRHCKEEADRLTDIGQQLNRLHFAGDVPSEQDLSAERSRRDRGWRLIRAAWRDGRPDELAEKEWTEAIAPQASLAEAYETSVVSADQTADRLRREAQRVTEHAGLVAGQNAGQDRLSDAKDHLEQAKVLLTQAESNWKAIWEPAGINPRSPKEMRAWLDQWQRFIQLARERQEAVTRWESKKHELEGTIGDLRAALEASGGLPTSLRPDASLGELAEVATKRVDEAGKLRLLRTRMSEDLVNARRDLATAKTEEAEAERDHNAWEGEWDAAIRFLGRPQRLSPDEANRDLDELMEFWKKVSDLKNRQSRIEGIEARSGAFPGDVAALALRLEGRRPDGEDPLRTYERLNARLQDAEQAGRSISDNQKASEQLREGIREKQEDVEVLRQRLLRLCQEACVAGPDQLPEAIRGSDELRDVDDKLAECESDLRVQGGVPDAELLKQQLEGGEGTRDYQQEKRALEEEIKIGQENLDKLNEQIGAAEQALEGLRGRSGAGNSVIELESEYGRLRRLVEEYVALSLASRVLSEAVRRYREGNSSGLLSEASAIFRVLTCQSFDHLAISEDQEQSFLVGVRADGSEVLIDGMSDGTCDQLYLALRLAHLIRHAAKEAPFPFIADDVLLTFDKHRARAALHCFSELGQSMQVLYFTHDRYTRDMAAEPEFAGKIGIRDLP